MSFLAPNLDGALKWLQRLAVFQLILGITLVVILGIVAATQPAEGWSGGFQAGFVEGLQGKNNDGGNLFLNADVGRSITVWLLFLIALNASIIMSLRRRDPLNLKIAVCTLLMISVYSGTPLSIALVIIMLTLTVKGAPRLHHHGLLSNSQTLPQ